MSKKEAILEKTSSSGTTFSTSSKVFLALGIIGMVFFVILLLTVALLSSKVSGNVALIQVNGVLTSASGGYFGEEVVSSSTLVGFIQDAEQDTRIKAIIIEINSPGGSPVATDEVGTALKKAKASKPVIAVIREVGASGGYWIASASDYIIANKMSITGSIGVYSSYLEFSGLMEKYGVGYEKLISGEQKDMGTPFQKLSPEARKIMQEKINKIHGYFMQEIATNRNLSLEKVKKLSTGEIYLGSEALELGLIDALGDRDTAEQYLKDKYEFTEINYVPYESEKGLLEMLSGVISQGFFNVGEGIGAGLLRSENEVMLK